MPTLVGYYAARDNCSAPACGGMDCSDNGGFTAEWPYLQISYTTFNYITSCVPNFPKLLCGAKVSVKNVDPRSVDYGRNRSFKIVQAGPGNACSAPTPGGTPLAIDLNTSGADVLATDFWRLGYLAVEITY
jgi:hypothetical protein